MLWAVRNKWPSCMQFTFNCYRHWATLVVRDTGDGSGHFLHSKEGVTQGDRPFPNHSTKSLTINQSSPPPAPNRRSQC